jgi:two-component system sensor histidine kinase DesK
LGGPPWQGGLLGRALQLIPLVLVLPPLVAFVLRNPPGERLASLVPAVAVFIAILVWAFAAPRSALSGRALMATFLLTVLSVVVVLIDPASHWLVLFFYPAAAAGLLASARQASLAIVGVAAVAAIASTAVVSDPANQIERPLEIAFVGFASLALARLVTANRELALARAEIARLAANGERLRIARDLHDLLGHGLSLIVLKAELAGRLLPTNAARAAVEVADIETVSRRALDDVRAAVGGYRRLTLDSELAGARTALETAGVSTEVDHQAGSLPDDCDEAFAWSIREGATNVVRHARARRAVIRTRRDAGAALLEIVNDGARSTGGADGRTPSGSRAGSGLAGLAERAGAIGGRIEAAPLPDGGYRLMVTIPLEVDRP